MILCEAVRCCASHREDYQKIPRDGRAFSLLVMEKSRWILSAAPSNVVNKPNSTVIKCSEMKGGALCGKNFSSSVL